MIFSLVKQTGIHKEVNVWFSSSYLLAFFIEGAHFSETTGELSLMADSRNYYQKPKHCVATIDLPLIFRSAPLNIKTQYSTRRTKERLPHWKTKGLRKLKTRKFNCRHRSMRRNGGKAAEEYSI